MADAHRAATVGAKYQQVRSGQMGSYATGVDATIVWAESTRKHESLGLP